VGRAGWAGTLPERAFAIVDSEGGLRVLREEPWRAVSAHRQLMALSGYARGQADPKAFFFPPRAPIRDGGDAVVAEAIGRSNAFAPAAELRRWLRDEPYLKNEAAAVHRAAAHYVPVATPAPCAMHRRGLPEIAEPISKATNTAASGAMGQLYAVVVIPKGFGSSQTTVHIQHRHLQSIFRTACSRRDSALRLNAARKSCARPVRRHGNPHVSAGLRS